MPKDESYDAPNALTVPRIIPGTISVSDLKEALKQENAEKKLDRIFEICIAATPNDETSPTIPRDKILSLLGKAKQIDLLAMKERGEQSAAKNHMAQAEQLFAKEHLEQMKIKLTLDGISGEDLLEIITDRLEKSTITKPKGLGSQAVENLRENKIGFKRRISTDILLWHLDSKQLRDEEKVVIADAIAEVVVHSAKAQEAILKIMAASSEETSERILETVLRICKNNPHLKEDIEFREGLAAIPASNIRQKEIVLQILAELGGKKAVASISKILNSEKSLSHEARQLAIDALAANAIYNPITAILGLKTYAQNVKDYEGNVKVALDRIPAFLAGANTYKFMFQFDFWTAMAPSFKDEGMSRWQMFRTRTRILKFGTEGEEITSMTKLAEKTMDLVKPGFHPFKKKRAEKIFRAIASTGLKEQSETVVKVSRIVRW